MANNWFGSQNVIVRTVKTIDVVQHFQTKINIISGWLESQTQPVNQSEGLCSFDSPMDGLYYGDILINFLFVFFEMRYKAPQVKSVQYPVTKIEIRKYENCAECRTQRDKKTDFFLLVLAFASADWYLPYVSRRHTKSITWIAVSCLFVCLVCIDIRRFVCSLSIRKYFTRCEVWFCFFPLISFAKHGTDTVFFVENHLVLFGSVWKQAKQIR